LNTNVVGAPNANQTWNTDAFSGITKNIDWLCGGMVYTVSTTSTIPANIHLVAGEGCQFSVNNGITLTFNGSLAGSSKSLHFSGSGHVALLNAEPFYPEYWGDIPDGVTDNHLALQSMVDSVNTSGGGRIILPTGESYMGNSLTNGVVLQFTVGNVSITCPLVRACTLSFTHTLGSVFGASEIGFINANGFVGNPLTNFEVSGFIINDRQTSQADIYFGDTLLWYGTYANISLHDMTINNVKGNSSAHIWGSYVYVYNNIFTGTMAGGYSYGSGVNWSGQFWWVHDNKIDGGYSGCGFSPDSGSSDLYVYSNRFDCTTATTTPSGVMGIGKDNQFFYDNMVVDLRAYNNAITVFTFNNDANTTISNVQIHDNIFYSRYNRAMLISRNGVGTPAFTNVTIANNQFYGPIEVHADLTITGQWHITGNTFDMTNNTLADHRAMTGWFNTPIDSHALVRIEGNTIYGYCRGGGAMVCPNSPSGGFTPMLVIDYTSWLLGKSRQVIVRNNRLGQTLFDSQNGQIDGHTSAATVNVNATSISATQTASVLGALPGDSVRFVDGDGTNLAVGVQPFGYVSSGDTVTWWLVNSSGSNYTHAGQVIQIYVDRSN
jgi:hypothetical protein